MKWTRHKLTLTLGNTPNINYCNDKKVLTIRFHQDELEWICCFFIGVWTGWRKFYTIFIKVCSIFQNAKKVISELIVNSMEWKIKLQSGFSYFEGYSIQYLLNFLEEIVECEYFFWQLLLYPLWYKLVYISTIHISSIEIYPFPNYDDICNGF